MKLPGMRYADGIRKGVQVQFGGLNHTLGAGDGELWDMRNLTSDYYPLLAARAPRLRYKTLAEPGGLFAWDGLAWVDGTGFYFDGEKKGTVAAGQKTFAALGAYIVIWPDKAWYNTATGAFGRLEASWSGTSLTFTNGKLFGEDADANCIQAGGVSWEGYFRAGDAVTIEGCTRHPENNKTPIIREIDGDKLYFYEFAFALDGDEGDEPYTETGALSISRTVPDLDYLCENENRLWGCKGDTICASKPGDPFNWNVFDGLDSDSYAVDTGSAGSFTGCISYLGYPVFFKEDYIFKVYGSLPSNFEVMRSATLGVAAGSGGSLAVAGETLLYLSPAGIVAYAGGIPQPVGAAFGLERHRNAAAGSDGLKYYVSMEREDGGAVLAVYDTRTGLWHLEDGTRATHFARHGGNLYFLSAGGEMWLAGNAAQPPEGAVPEGEVAWMAEFGDFTEGDPNKKGVSKLQIRLELDEGAEMAAFLQFDSDGVWRKVSAVGPPDGGKRSYYLPIIPRRADHYRLRLEGTGGCRVYSLAREYYSGSELKSRQGRQ